MSIPAASMPATAASAPRDLHADLMRIAAALAIVLLHVSAQVLITYRDPHSLNWWAGNLTNTFSRWGVPLFVMISGGLLLSAPPPASLLDFYRRRASRIVVPLLFWSVVYTAIRLRADPESLDPRHGLAWNLLEPFLRGVPEPHLWFLFMIAGLYLVTPFLQIFVQSCPPRLLRGCLAAGFLLIALHLACSMLHAPDPPSIFFTFPLFLPYYLAGYALRSGPLFRLSRPKFLWLIAVCVAICASAYYLLRPVLGDAAEDLAWSERSPLVALISLAVYELLRSIPTARLSRPSLWMTRRLPPLTMGIYLIHPITLLLFLKLHWNLLWDHAFAGIPIVTLILFFATAAIAWLFARLPWLRATIG